MLLRHRDFAPSGPSFGGFKDIIDAVGLDLKFFQGLRGDFSSEASDDGDFAAPNAAFLAFFRALVIEACHESPVVFTGGELFHIGRSRVIFGLGPSGAFDDEVLFSGEVALATLFLRKKFAVGIVGGVSGGEGAVMFGGVELESPEDISTAVDRLGLVGLLLDPVDGGGSEGGQNSDDGDHDQKFDEGEGRVGLDAAVHDVCWGVCGVRDRGDDK